MAILRESGSLELIIKEVSVVILSFQEISLDRTFGFVCMDNATFAALPTMVRPNFYSAVSELISWLACLCFIGNIDLCVCVTGMQPHLEDKVMERHAGHGKDELLLCH